MAMTMTGEATFPAARSRVWALLNDPEVLKVCIPGCQSLEKVGDNGFAAVAKVKIGPVSATFKGKVELSDIVPDVGYTISGEGEGGIAGFAKGGAKVWLADAEDGTLLRYDVEAHVGGKMAQLGSRLIDGVAKGMADKFFASFAEEAAKAGPVADAGASGPFRGHVTHHSRRGAAWPAPALGGGRDDGLAGRGAPRRAARARCLVSAAATSATTAAAPQVSHPERHHGSGGFGDGSCLDDGEWPACVG